MKRRRKPPNAVREFFHSCTDAGRSHGWQALAYGVPIVLLLLLVCLLGDEIARYSRGLERYRVSTEPLRRLPLPENWDPELADCIAPVYFEKADYSIYDPRLTREISQAFEAHPWVRRVRSVRKEFPNRVLLDVELRRPAAAVLASGVPLAVDDHGVRLPIDFRIWPRGLQILPRIIGVAGTVPEPGEAWRDPSVRAALGILHLLADSRRVQKRLTVLGVDVTNYHGRKDPAQCENVVIAADHCLVHFGRAPDDDPLGELPPGEKIAKLEEFLVIEPRPRQIIFNIRYRNGGIILPPPGELSMRDPR